jgi:hypothetical protein
MDEAYRAANDGMMGYPDKDSMAESARWACQKMPAGKQLEFF